MRGNMDMPRRNRRIREDEYQPSLYDYVPFYRRPVTDEDDANLVRQ